MIREPVTIETRRAMTRARKARIWINREGKCWMCGKSVPQRGAGVRFDHKLPLELGGTDDDANIWPLHTEPCDRIKTAADRQRIDKAKRLARKANEPKAPGSIRSRGFDKTKTRRFDGTVTSRKLSGGALSRQDGQLRESKQ